MRHIAYGDIEHIVPKSVVPERWFDWQNLTLACDVCNGNKSDFHGDHDTFVDPDTLNPDDHFLLMGALVFPKPGSDAGAITERVLKLNRSELVERRAERLKALMKHLEVIQRTKDPHLKKILEKDFLEEAKADKEFAALAREIVRTAQSRLGLAGLQDVATV